MKKQQQTVLYVGKFVKSSDFFKKMDQGRNSMEGRQQLLLYIFDI